MRKSWKSSRKLAVGIAMALGCSMASVAFADQTITEPIIGPDNLSFSENVTFEVSNNLIAGGPWLPNIAQLYLLVKKVQYLILIWMATLYL